MKATITLTACMVLLFSAAGCQVNPATGQTQLMLISTQEEIALGRQAAPEFEEQFGGPVPDPALQDYVSRVGMRLAAGAERDLPWEFKVLRSDLPNAFALPGGFLYVTAGLMAQMESEEELAAVLGHEIAHVTARHNISGLQRQMGVLILAELAAIAIGAETGDMARVATQVVGGMVNLSYSRNQEHEADELGIRYMDRADYSPWGMVDLMETLGELGGRGDPGRVQQLLSSHPLTSERISRATALAAQNEPQRPRLQATGQYQRMRQAAAAGAVPHAQIQRQLEQRGQ